MTSDKLAVEIEQNGIEIIEMNFKGSTKGLYAADTIAINPCIKKDSEKRCVLAEELGHHYTSCGDILNPKDIKCIKQEKRARNWSYEKLVGIIDIINAFNLGIRTRYDMAEHLNVTEEFLEEAICHYKQKYGICMEIDEYLVYFEPSFIVVKKF